MNDARETDILYLAHQLWEEDDASPASAQSYWQEAARQVLARGGQPHDPSRAPARQGRLNAQRHLAFKQSGAALCIDMGAKRHTKSVALTAHRDQTQIANSSQRLLRLID